MEPSDEELVRRVTEGERPVFELLMRRHNRRMFRVLRSILHDRAAAEDAMQQAYISAYLHLGSFAGRSRFATWLLRIAVHEALAHLRRARRLGRLEALLTDGDPSPPPHTPEDACADRELASRVEKAVDALPDRYRVVFVLRQIEGVSTLATARILGTTAEVVKTRLHRARALLRGSLDAFTDEQLEETYTFGGERCDRLVAAVLAAVGGT